MRNLNSTSATEGHRTTNSTLQDLRRDHLRVVQKEPIRHKLREASFFHSLSCSLLHSNRKSAEKQQEDLASQHLSLPQFE